MEEDMHSKERLMQPKPANQKRLTHTMPVSNQLLLLDLIRRLLQCI